MTSSDRTFYGANLHVTADNCKFFGSDCVIIGDNNTSYGNRCDIRGDNNTNFGKNCKIRGDNNTNHGPGTVLTAGDNYVDYTLRYDDDSDNDSEEEGLNIASWDSGGISVQMVSQGGSAVVAPKLKKISNDTVLVEGTKLPTVNIGSIMAGNKTRIQGVLFKSKNDISVRTTERGIEVSGLAEKEVEELTAKQ